MKRVSVGQGSPQAGVSLIELMISLTIGAIILLAVTVVFSRISTGARVTDAGAQAMENGNFALRVLGDDIRLSGFIGLYSDPSRVQIARSDLMSTDTTQNCGATDFAFQFLDPANNQVTFLEYLPNLTTTNPLGCLTSSHFIANSPAVVLRHATGDQVRDANNNGSLSEDFTATDYQLYVQSGSDGAIIFMGKDYASQIKGAGRNISVYWKSGTTVSKVDAPAFRYAANVYYIRPCSRPAGTTCATTDDRGMPIPTLVRRQLSTNSATVSFVETPVAEGVERMAAVFGIDTNEDGVPDRYITSPTSAQMGQALTVKLSLLLRTREFISGHDDSAVTYTLADGSTFNCTSAGVNCAYRHYLFNDTIQLKNYAYRR